MVPGVPALLLEISLFNNLNNLFDAYLFLRFAFPTFYCVKLRKKEVLANEIEYIVNNWFILKC